MPAALLLSPRWRGVRWLGSRLLDGVPACVGTARSWVADRLTADVHGLPVDALDAVRLLTSELVTNAVVHSYSAGGLLMVRVGVTFPDVASRLVHIEVADNGSEARPVVTPDAAGEGGRGLFLVEAMSARWGAVDEIAGRVVWCQVPYAA